MCLSCPVSYEFCVVELCRRIIRSGLFFFLMIRGPPRSTLDRSSAASDVYKRQRGDPQPRHDGLVDLLRGLLRRRPRFQHADRGAHGLSLIHISEPTRPY